MLYWCLLILITIFEIQTGKASKYSEASIIEKLTLEKNHTYMINFLRTGQVQHNFDCTVITTNDYRSNTYYILSTSLVCYNLENDRKNVNHLHAMFI